MKLLYSHTRVIKMYLALIRTVLTLIRLKSGKMKGNFLKIVISVLFFIRGVFHTILTPSTT